MSYQIERVVVPPDALRLALNENTAGCSPAVQEAIRAVTRAQVACYPAYEAATEAVAARLKAPAERVLLTNGLDEGILLLSLAALRGNRTEAPLETIIVPPNFDMYPIYTEAVGGRVVAVAAGPDLRVPVDRVLAAIGPRTRLVWITNPNNPSGLTLARDEILGIAAAAPQAIVVADEAYADFAGRSLLDDPPFERLPNIVVGRTFSKAYGMAGLRAGALVAAPAALEPMRRLVPPYSLNVCAAAALPAACADTAYYGWYLDQVRESKDLMYAALDRLGIEHWRSSANFVLARFGARAADVVGALSARGVLVRDRSRDPACPGCVRITTGIVAHTRACIAALEDTPCAAG